MSSSTRTEISSPVGQEQPRIGEREPSKRKRKTEQTSGVLMTKVGMLGSKHRKGGVIAFQRPVPTCIGS